MRAIYGLGRFVLGGFFLYSGINHLTNTESMAEYAASKGTPNPKFDVEATGVLMSAAGASVALGIEPKLGALGILAFLAAATPVFHDFWTQSDPKKKSEELRQFWNNVALMGATLAVLGAEGSADSTPGQS